MKRNSNCDRAMGMEGARNERLSLVRWMLSENDGGSLVEFALVVPMMMMMITGLFSIGIALNNYMEVTNGVNAGARAFALSRGVTVSNGSTQAPITDPCAYAVQMAKASGPVLNSSASTFSITWTPNGGTAQSYTTSCSGISLSSGDTVQVQATYPVSMIVYGWKPGKLNMAGQSTELVQ
jgi:Flp pilus assembly protein TadG